MLRKIRIFLAAFFFLGITLMLMDFTGTLHGYLGWMAKLQFWPAVLAIPAGTLVLVLAWLLITLLFGRIYCSTVCPLGILQDIFTHVRGWFPRQKNRFTYRRELRWVRYGVLALFVALVVFGLTSLSALIAPYSAYGRIVQSIFAPAYAYINNVLAGLAEHYDSYAFYATDVWLKSGLTLAIAIATLLLVAHLAFYHGRWWCSTICPVGTMLGTISRHAIYRPTIDTNKCNSCGLCAKRCKAECIDPKTHTIDSSRCVDCFDCLDICRQQAISISRHSISLRRENTSNDADQQAADTSRRRFLGVVGGMAVASTISAKHKVMDGGLAVIEDKQIPERATAIKPAGSLSLKHFQKHCTACQLCVSACPSGVLRPSSSLITMMQPEMSFERGYCDITCHACADVCPTGAITHILPEEKTSIQVGHAVWIRENCVVLTEGDSCGNCAKHCPTGAITMVDTPEGRIPAVDTSRCIGCGTCEYLCPSRPLSAIYVEGQSVHQTI